MGDEPITVVGTLTDDPHLRYAPAGLRPRWRLVGGRRGRIQACHANRQRTGPISVHGPPEDMAVLITALTARHLMAAATVRSSRVLLAELQFRPWPPLGISALALRLSLGVRSVLAGAYDRVTDNNNSRSRPNRRPVPTTLRPQPRGGPRQPTREPTRLEPRDPAAVVKCRVHRIETTLAQRLRQWRDLRSLHRFPADRTARTRPFGVCHEA
jgi:hypothetical protein